jgi:hypothetical protein
MLEQFMKPLASVDDYNTLNQILLHIDYVNLRYTYEEMTVNPIDAYRYQGNLYGLFRLMNLEPAMFVYTMHLNGYNSPLNFEGLKTVFKIPVAPPIPY